MKTRTIAQRKTIALVAHDNKKDELLKWVKNHRSELTKHRLVATGTTGKMIAKELETEIQLVMSGPLGGDQQLGAMIAEGKIDIVIFFWDPMEAQPHDSDVKAFLRICAVWNTVVASDASTADFIISSPFMDSEYETQLADYTKYLNRKIEA